MTDINSHKTETILDVNLPKHFIDWATKNIPREIFIALLPIFEKSFRHTGAKELDQLIERFNKLNEKTISTI